MLFYHDITASLQKSTMFRLSAADRQFRVYQQPSGARSPPGVVHQCLLLRNPAPYSPSHVLTIPLRLTARRLKRACKDSRQRRWCSMGLVWGWGGEDGDVMLGLGIIRLLGAMVIMATLRAKELRENALIETWNTWLQWYFTHKKSPKMSARTACSV